MSTVNKSPRKTPHKPRNIIQQDDEKIFDVSDERIEEKSKTVAAPRNRRKSTIINRNVPEESIQIISDEEIEKKIKKTPKKKIVKKAKAPTTKVVVSDSSDSKESAKKQDLEKTPPKKDQKNLRHRTPSTKALENVAADASPSCDSIELKNTRRSLRVRSPRKRLIEGETSKSKKTMDSSTLSDISGFTEGSDSDLTDVEKPSTLFGDGDVDGQHLFGFKTPKKADGMLAMAARTPKPSNIFGTPKSDKSFPNPKTPHHLRVKTKKQLVKAQMESESDFSADESDDYQPNSNSEESDEDEEKSQIEDSPIKKLSITSVRSSTRNQIKEGYVPQSDDYFSHHTKKLPTSNHTLDRLKNPRLQQDQLFSLLKDLKLPAEHEKSIKELHLDYQSWYQKWIHILREGFNILLYGLGSKRNLLINFHSTMLKNENVLVVNGFFPSLTIKDILDDISEILELGSSGNDLMDRIEEKMLESSDECHLFLLIHNIDGIMLRNSNAQTILSRLATFHKIHLICSIDHINTPLLWDQAKLGNYNFSWWDVTTLLPYSDETAFENSLLVQNSGSLALSSMKSVFQSLTKNTKGVYMLIVKQQIANKGQPNYQGMLFKDLYTKSRESFLCSSDLALRAQLTEFLDHKLVKTKRGADGAEYLNIPLQYGLLQQFVEQQEAN